MRQLTYYTHAGRFHTDEALGYVIAKAAELCDRYIRLDITDGKALPTDGMLADIGRDYNWLMFHFDHHQGAICRLDGSYYATAGLLWKHYGIEVVSNHIRDHRPDITTIGNYELATIYFIVEDIFIKGIDANDADNAYQVTAIGAGGEFNVYSLPMIVAGLNHTDPYHKTQAERFETALSIITISLYSAIDTAINKHLASEKFKSTADFLTAQIVILRESILWYHIIADHPDVHFVIAPSNHPGSQFSLSAVPVNNKSRAVKTQIERPDWFTGFIHEGKWIAGANDVETLIKLAEHNLNKTPI